MSVFVIGEIWTRDLDHNEQAVLLALADHADDDGGTVYPSLARVAWKTGYSVRQTRRIIGSLVDVGYLRIVTRATRYRPTEYRIDLAAIPLKPAFREDNMSSLPDDPREDIPAPREDTIVAVEGGHDGVRQTITEPSSLEPSASAATPLSERRRDPLWEFLYLVETGTPWADGTRIPSNLRGRINAARKQAADAGYDEASLRVAVMGWPVAMGSARITANALVTNAVRCAAAADGRSFQTTEEAARAAASGNEYERLAAERQAFRDEEDAMRRRYEETHGGGG